MANINDTFAGVYLKASDLRGGEPVVVIESVAEVELGGKKKLEISFVGKEKHLIANLTNSHRIAEMFGFETDDWVGKKIQLYTEKVEYRGKYTEAIRVRVAKPPVVRKPAAQFDDPVADIGETF